MAHVLSFTRPRPAHRRRRVRRGDLRLLIIAIIVASAAVLSWFRGDLNRPSREQMATYHFTSCDQARAVGAAPMYMSEPWYNPDLDGDGDGWACEPPPHR